MTSRGVYEVPLNFIQEGTIQEEEFKQVDSSGILDTLYSCFFDAHWLLHQHDKESQDPVHLYGLYSYLSRYFHNIDKILEIMPKPRCSSTLTGLLPATTVLTQILQILQLHDFRDRMNNLQNLHNEFVSHLCKIKALIFANPMSYVPLFRMAVIFSMLSTPIPRIETYESKFMKEKIHLAQ